MDFSAELLKVGQVTKALREERGITQLAFAEATGMDIYTQNLLEQGKYDITMVEIVAITEYLQITLAEYFKEFTTKLSR